MFSRPFLNEKEQQAVQYAIAEAELLTSGEIRVHIESSSKMAVLDRAVEVFKYLKMDQTRQRNGVLIYLAWIDRKFGIIGDKGINDLVPDGFWDEVRNAMAIEFKKGDFAEGLIKGIGMAGEKLSEFFPPDENDKNELSNDVSYGA